MGRINKQNLRTPTSEEAREMQKKSVEKRRENKAMREIYEQVIADKKTDIVRALNKGIDEGNLATLRELREGTEGSKINLSGTVKAEMETTEERLKIFEELVGNESV
jgi:hypothetical protein